MSTQPELHADIYDAIDPEKFKGSQKGKTALVIGSARGIGQGVALQLAKAGANIATFDILDPTETVELVRKEGVEAKGWRLDASPANEAGFNKAIDEVEAWHQIDILVNVAGIVRARPLEMESFSNFWRSMEINCGTALISMLKVLPFMKARRSGVIINIASRAGTIDYPGSTSYAVSKSAVIRLTGCAQVELNTEGYGEDIQVYCLHPGGVLTDMPKSICHWHLVVTLAAIPDDVAAKYPERVKMRNDWLPKFITSRFLCGATCVYLASGKAKVLKGRYFDCEQDIGTVVAAGKEVLDEDLYSLRVRFLGGLPNDGGIAKDPAPPVKNPA